MNELAQLRLLSRALHTCHSQRALLHLSDEGGEIDHVYQLWPFIVRVCASAALCSYLPKVLELLLLNGTLDFEVRANFLFRAHTTVLLLVKLVRHRLSSQIRSYYSQALARKWNGTNKLLFSPLGYGSGFWQKSLSELHRSGPLDLVDGTCRRRNNDNNDYNKERSGGGAVDGVNSLAARSFDWVFVGNGRKRSRPAQLQALHDAMPVHALISSTGFLGRGAVGLGSVARPLMEDSVFCPVPCG
jgi:hypothetical protein